MARALTGLPILRIKGVRFFIFSFFSFFLGLGSGMWWAPPPTAPRSDKKGIDKKQAKIYNNSKSNPQEVKTWQKGN